MSLILNIDTSTEKASICLSEKENCLCLLENDSQKDHASWLHPAIFQAFKISGKNLNNLEAVGITLGPGSYTGLRIGMSAAKGLCYALNIPLIGVNTLEAMASAALNEETDYICPMIDARRMEVFTGLYDKQLKPMISPCALILDKMSFFEFLKDKKILFLGTGKKKFKEILGSKNAIFKNLIFNSTHLSLLTYKKFVQSDFEALAYVEPLYLKELQTNLLTKS